jgi:hypothetical protein
MRCGRSSLQRGRGTYRCATWRVSDWSLRSSIPVEPVAVGGALVGVVIILFIGTIVFHIQRRSRMRNGGQIEGEPKLLTSQRNRPPTPAIKISPAIDSGRSTFFPEPPATSPSPPPSERSRPSSTTPPLSPLWADQLSYLSPTPLELPPSISSATPPQSPKGSMRYSFPPMASSPRRPSSLGSQGRLTPDWRQGGYSPQRRSLLSLG